MNQIRTDVTAALAKLEMLVSEVTRLRDELGAQVVDLDERLRKLEEKPAAKSHR